MFVALGERPFEAGESAIGEIQHADIFPPSLFLPRSRSSMVHPNCPRPRMPDQRKTLSLLAGLDATLDAERVPISSRRPRNLKWGIILPLTSRGVVGGEPGPGVWERLESNALLLVKSLNARYVALPLRVSSEHVPSCPVGRLCARL